MVFPVDVEGLRELHAGTNEPFTGFQNVVFQRRDINEDFLSKRQHM